MHKKRGEQKIGNEIDNDKDEHFYFYTKKIHENDLMRYIKWKKGKKLLMCSDSRQYFTISMTIDIINQPVGKCMNGISSFT